MKAFVLGGGGTLGSCIAFAVAREGLMTEVVLSDRFNSAAEHHAFDIQEAVCLTNRTKVRAGNAEDMADADIVINAIGLPLDWTKITPEENMAQLKDAIKETAGQLAVLAKNAVVISVTNPLDPVNYFLWKCSGLRREQFVGCSYNDTLRLRKGIAAFLRKDAGEVEAFVVGGHDRTKVSLYSSATAGKEVLKISDEEREIIEKNMADAWKNFLNLGVKRTAGWTTSFCVGKMVRAIARELPEKIPCSVIPPEDFLFSDVSIGLPVSLCRNGVSEIALPDMSAEEERALQDSVDSVRSVIKACEEIYR